jgi:hypothetical protein
MGRSSRDGIRHARRMSNWTAAVLIAGSGAAAVAMVEQASHSAAAAPAGGITPGASAPGDAGPRVTHAVATTAASGVSATTTTRTVNGKTVITRVTHLPAAEDN